jgi:eukaryotic-like serine/threonine-protein kinase
MSMASVQRVSWELAEGDAIAPGRTVLRRLGGGNLYEAYLVWDELLLSICVAKIVRPDQAEDQGALEDLREEAEMLAALAHPVIVRGFDAVLEGRYPHLLIEHLEGPPLRRLIKRGGPAPLEQLLPLALHVVAALHYMERMGFVHLDVKPDNIIMGIPPRLIDLSIARSLERASRTKGPIGTDAYMAPEQCGPGSRQPAIGPAADIWGLGATLYHTASGRRPFPRESGAATSDDPVIRFPQLSVDPDPLPRELPGDLRALIGEMLSMDPANRPLAADVARRLEPLVAALPSRVVVTRRGLRGR